MNEQLGDDRTSNTRTVVFRWPVALGIAILLALAIAAFAFFSRVKSTEQLIENAKAALESGQNDAAMKLARQALSQSPQSQDAILMAAHVATAQGDVRSALSFYDQLADDGSEATIAARISAGEMAKKNRLLTPAIQHFQRAFEQDANSVVSSENLAALFGSCSRAHEAIAHRLVLIREGKFDTSELYFLSLDDSRAEDPTELHKYFAADKNDPSCLLGEARLAIDEQEFDKAQRMLRKAIEIAPNLLAAHVRLGQLLLDQAPEKFLSWHEALPKEAHEAPAIWTLRGRWASRVGDNRVAIRCFWESLRRDPNQQMACYQLGHLLVNEGSGDDAEAFLNRSRMMESYRNVVDAAKTGKDFSNAQRATELAESLGLIWEAFGWSYVVFNVDPQVAWARRTYERLRPRIRKLALRRTIDDANPALRIDLSSFPLPDWKRMSKEPSDGARHPNTPKVTFYDDAERVGISFQYVNGGQPKTGTTRIFESTGGGVAVLDYDNDGWPDIYLTQGCSWPPMDDDHKHVDKLYRNRGDGTFEDVTDVAGLAENGYSQGATVGDFNNDGFPDLYVANIGENRLYVNNSDGTFTDVTRAANVAGDRWTTSCVIADFDGDTLPDIFAVNYLGGDLARICGRGKETGICHPSNFPAAQDNLYLNLGDGRFEDVTLRCGIAADDGKGLGVVAGNLLGTGNLDLFVANDAVANFFFANGTKRASGPLQFKQNAILLGLALAENGLAAGCMGIATGDADRDGLLDLFVTNFAGEANSFYVQKRAKHFGSLFEDENSKFGVSAISYPLVGFGTQFIDTDLDGYLDLVVANGHIGKFEGKEYQMRPQYFHNVKGIRFVEAASEDLGSYFMGKYLGRGFARLDWNRDGKEDAVISHVDAPAALLTNTTQTVGHHLAIRLVGVQSDRDAIGTILVGKSGGESWTHQLTAGDGYLASNQRQIVFGLGDHTRLDELTVRWPFGNQQKFDHVSAGTEYIIIENRGTLIPLP